MLTNLVCLWQVSWNFQSCSPTYRRRSIFLLQQFCNQQHLLRVGLSLPGTQARYEGDLMRGNGVCVAISTGINTLRCARE